LLDRSSLAPPIKSRVSEFSEILSFFWCYTGAILQAKMFEMKEKSAEDGAKMEIKILKTRYAMTKDDAAAIEKEIKKHLKI